MFLFFSVFLFCFCSFWAIMWKYRNIDIFPPASIRYRYLQKYRYSIYRFRYAHHYSEHKKILHLKIIGQPITFFYYEFYFVLLWCLLWLFLWVLLWLLSLLLWVTYWCIYDGFTRRKYYKNIRPISIIINFWNKIPFHV